MTRSLAALPLAVLLTSCAAPVMWSNPNSNPQQFEADKAICMSQALGMTNRSNEWTQGSTLPAPAYSGATTNCSSMGYSVTCNTQLQQNPYASLNTGPQYNWGAAIANNRTQQIHFEGCMYSKGYRKDTVNSTNAPTPLRPLPNLDADATLTGEEAAAMGMKKCIYENKDRRVERYVKASEACSKSLLSRTQAQIAPNELPKFSSGYTLEKELAGTHGKTCVYKASDGSSKGVNVANGTPCPLIPE
jgi:hypothetical protein